jgi:aminoglycoside phosphotransferase family enzyme/predicted kinase
MTIRAGTRTYGAVDDNTEALEWLAAGAGLGAPADRVIDTPAARVVLIGHRAYKLKKAVDFGFLDYSTVERRVWATRRELAFNREGAPTLYRAVRWIRRSADGVLALDGPGDDIEIVLEMRRFADESLLAAAPGRLDGDLSEALGRAVARSHAASAPDPDAGGPPALGYTITSNAQHLRALAPVLGADAVERVVSATAAAFERLAPLLTARTAAGFGRRCHGDLHLGNVLVEDGAPVLFDCIEFNDRLSRIDVLYDLAFLLMDLSFRGRDDAACRVLAGWIDEAARHGLAGLDGLAALPLFQSVRAAVRTHVSAANGDIALARDYLAAAEAHFSPPPPRLVAVGGLSGSGKSTLARAAAPALGPAPGAVVLRSDEVRKRLWNAAPLERLPPSAYAAGESERVYARLFQDAAVILTAGHAVVLDAVFLRPCERAAAARIAAEHGFPFTGVWLYAPAEVLRSRVSARTGDVSDADAAVLERQLQLDPGPLDWTVVDASAPLPARLRAAGLG